MSGVDLAAFYRERPRVTRKGDYGRLLVVGGSERYSGAPAFNALAALRAGVDIVTVVAPRRAADIVAGFGADLITVPCSTHFPDPDMVLGLAQDFDAVVIGGGVARTSAAHDALRRIINGVDKPIVIDAEGLRAIADHEAHLTGRRVVLTPHGGEFEALANAPWPTEPADRNAACASLALRYHSVVAVKGRDPVVSDGNQTATMDIGSSFLTKGGYGDLIAGVTGAHMARGVAPYDAARLGIDIVARAGVRAAAQYGEATLASDALAQIARVVTA